MQTLRIILFDGSYKTTPFINRLAKGLAEKHQVFILGFNEKLQHPVDGVYYPPSPPPPLTDLTFNQAITDALALDSTGNTAIPVYGVMSTWDVSQVTNMVNAFQYKTSFNADISAWDTSNVTEMWNMFDGATAFNQDIGSWNVSNVIKFGWMFNDAGTFNQDLNSWDVSSADTLYRMFRQAASFNQPLNNWSFGPQLQVISAMFQDATSFNQPLDNWSVNNITSMGRMFEDATSYNQDLSGWNVALVTSCIDFSTGAAAWVDPKPTFTACTP